MNPDEYKKRNKRGRPSNRDRQQDGPTFFLNKYKTTERPRPCSRCQQNAYYYHEEFGYLCAPHLLDLVNIGGTAFDWDDYPEVWDRTTRLLKRPKPQNLSTTAKSMEQELENRPAQKPQSSDSSSNRRVQRND